MEKNILPEINFTFTSKILSTGKEIMGRPMRVRDEKAILLAKENKDLKIFFNTIKNIIQYVYPDIKFDELTPYDLKYLFIDHNRKNIDKEIELKEFKCEKCNNIFINQIIDLEKDLKIENKKVKIKDTIEIIPGIKVKIEFPKMKSLLKYFEQFENDIFNMDVIADCVSEVIDERNELIKVYKRTDFSHKEMIKWIEKLPIMAFEKISNWINENNLEIYLEKEFICPECGEKTVKRLDDFYFF